MLLLHANALNAEYLGELAGMLSGRGYRFESLDQALADSAYRSRDDFVGPRGPSWPAALGDHERRNAGRGAAGAGLGGPGRPRTHPGALSFATGWRATRIAALWRWYRRDDRVQIAMLETARRSDGAGGMLKLHGWSGVR